MGDGAAVDADPDGDPVSDDLPSDPGEGDGVESGEHAGSASTPAAAVSHCRRVIVTTPSWPTSSAAVDLR